MSVRAYQITYLTYEDTPTFNLWHDDELVQFLEPCIPTSFPYDGGYVEFCTEDLEEALQEAKAKKASRETCETLQRMIAVARTSEFGWVKYWCF